MDGGKIIAEGSPAELIATHCSTNTIRLPRASVEATLEGLDLDYQADDSTIFIRTANVDEVLTRLISAGLDLTDMSVQSPNLEDVFLILTGKQLRD
jgi:ABC-type multidrug transport system ATPase subunit